MSSSSASSSSLASSKKAAAAELHLVESKLNEINHQLISLKQERALLQARKASLKDILEQQDITPDVDWADDASFPWSVEVVRLKEQIFGITAPWRVNQKEVINATLSGRDVFVIMRTGGGKSMCYQLPALLGLLDNDTQEGKGKNKKSSSSAAAGITLVISPLLSLITDQVYNLDTLLPGASAMLTGTMSREETTAVLQRMRGVCTGGGAAAAASVSGKQQQQQHQQAPLRLVYCTPEKIIKSKQLLGVLEKLNEADQLSRIVIDEAHCCSEHGMCVSIQQKKTILQGWKTHTHTHTHNHSHQRHTHPVLSHTHTHPHTHTHLHTQKQATTSASTIPNWASSVGSSPPCPSSQSPPPPPQPSCAMSPPS
jgi:ATP-dependent DNA helicase Q1